MEYTEEQKLMEARINEFKKYLGKIIKRERIRQGIPSQVMLGDILGISNATISEIERGEHNTRIVTLLKILSYLNINLQIVNYEDSRHD